MRIFTHRSRCLLAPASMSKDTHFVSFCNKDHGTTDDGTTPLFVAAQQGHLEVVRFLVESGADKDQGTTHDGTTPLFIAAQHGHLEVVRFLVESGGDKDQGTTEDGATPFCIAAQQWQFEIVRFLMTTKRYSFQPWWE